VLTILVKTIANANNNILATSIADTNTSTYVTIRFTVYYIRQRSFFILTLLVDENRMTVVEKLQNHYSLQ